MTDLFNAVHDHVRHIEHLHSDQIAIPSALNAEVAFTEAALRVAVWVTALSGAAGKRTS